MADETGIAWTRSTANPWIGCTKVGPGCDGCYAETLDARHKWGGATHWGAGVPRHRTSEALRRRPLQWDRLCAWEKEHGELAAQWKGKWHTPGFWPVFCASLADVFDNEVPARWRDDLWQLIEATPNLSWLLVTKRIVNVSRFVYPGWMVNGFPPNVRILITVVNQEEADRDIPKLLALPCKNGISYEPALGPIDFAAWLYPTRARIDDQHLQPYTVHNQPTLQWIIIGGESNQGKHKGRPFALSWARSTVAQCKAAGVACFVKQLGSNAMPANVTDGRYQFRDRAGADPAEWPEDLRIQEFPL